MKRFLQSLAVLALIVVSIQGCSRNPEPEPESKIQLRLTGSINEATRVNADGFVADDAVGVYVSTTGTLAESGNYFDNVKFTYADSKLTSTTPIYWPTKDSQLSVFAYYPYSEGVSSVSEYPFSVAADQSVDGAFYKSDFIYAKETNIAPTGNEVALEFNHMLSRINVSLGVDGESGITRDDLAADKTKVMQFVGLANEGVIDLNNGTATVNNSTTTITPMAAADGLTYSAVVYPQTNKLTFRLDFGGRVYALSQNVTLKPGYQYTYNLTVNVWDQPQLSFTNVSVGNWTDGTGGDVTMSDFINIPDENFKAYLLQEKLYTEGYFDNPESLVSNGMIDANRDGQISIKEAEAVKMIHLYKGETVEEIEAADGRVASLEGIEYFTNLVYLNCHGNLLTTVDVSHNTKLESLDLMFNKLTALDVSKNVKLLGLSIGSYDAGYNEITEIDLSNNPELGYFGCENNAITSLDFSNNPDLCQIAISDNPFEYINLSQNRKLETMWVNNCGITSVNSETFNIANMPNLKEMHLNDNKDLKTIDLSQNTGLEHLSIRGTGLTSIDVTALENLGHFDCSVNDFSSAGTVDVSKNVKLYFLQVDNTKITSIDVSNNTELSHFGCDTNSGLTNIDVSKNTKLHHFHCFMCNIETLDLSNNTNIKELECNPMESLKAIYIPAADHKFDVLDIPKGVTPTIKNE